MKLKSFRFLVCPNCSSSLKLISKHKLKDWILDGKLVCKNIKCAREYFIDKGLAKLILFKYTDEKNVAFSFGFEWKAHHDGRIERETLFGRSEEEELAYFFKATSLKPQDLKGKLILDAGCGSAKLTRLISRFSPRYIFGVDIHSALNELVKFCRDNNICDVIQADIYNLPFPPETFDIIWCNGVLHHTPDPKEAFNQLAKYVKPNGLLYVWVYDSFFSPYKFIKNIFRMIGFDRIPHNYLFKLCQILTLISCIIHPIYRVITIPLLLFLKNSKRFTNTLRKRSNAEFLMTWFDALSPKYESRHTKKEVTEWFKGNGFIDLKYYDYQIGICGRKSI